MVTLLSKIFIKNRTDYQDEKVRESYGLITGALGIALNILVSVAKIVIGIITGAISILADGLNNMSDAGSSIISMVGFKLSNKPVDSKHPFGHGRIEYVSGLIVAVIVVVVGIELIISSIQNIVTPKEVNISVLSMCILAFSIVVKLYMFFYNYVFAKKINSLSMKATAMDSIGDAISTSAVLICSIVTYFTGLILDPYAGILVGLFILITGGKTLAEIVNRLIGEAPDKKLVAEITAFVLNYPIVRGIHDLVVHNYGEGRKMISLHVEIPSDSDIMEAHDVIDNIEHDLSQKFRCHALIHMDPVKTDDPHVNELKGVVTGVVSSINPEFTIHDFRMNEGPTHTNLIFDLVVPPENIKHADEIVKTVAARVREVNATYNCVINVDIKY